MLSTSRIDVDFFRSKFCTVCARLSFSFWVAGSETRIRHMRLERQREAILVQQEALAEHYPAAYVEDYVDNDFYREE